MLLVKKKKNLYDYIQFISPEHKHFLSLVITKIIPKWQHYHILYIYIWVDARAVKPWIFILYIYIHIYIYIYFFFPLIIISYHCNLMSFCSVREAWIRGRRWSSETASAANCQHWTCPTRGSVVFWVQGWLPGIHSPHQTLTCTYL